MQISAQTIKDWPDYELIDSGNGEKLERFGAYILARPEPQALWQPSLDESRWEQLAHARFSRNTDNPDKGNWQRKDNMPDRWFVNYPSLSGQKFQFRLALHGFKHVGIFPEQANNWEWLSCQTLAYKPHNMAPRLLNLFAYTGAASVIMQAGGGQVTHVEAIKQTTTWARENMEANRLDNIRWMVEDVLTFAKREARRGSLYQGILLDPPAYGRGPTGEKWLLEHHLNPLLQACKSILDTSRPHFILLNMYSMGFSSLVAQSLIQTIFTPEKLETGEFYLTDQANRALPLGSFCRFSSGFYRLMINGKW